MSIQYVVDEKGKKTAVLVPIDEWEALHEKYQKYEEDVLTLEEAEATDKAWAEYLADPSTGKSIEEVIREQLIERED